MQPLTAVAANGQVAYECPVNPLSHLLINISPLNETTAPATYRNLANMATAITQLQVTYQGNAVVALSGADLLQSLLWYWGKMPGTSNAGVANNERRSLVLPVIFGRQVYNSAEALPATRRGELQLLVTWAIAGTTFDGLQISIESVELPEAAPTHFLKYTSLVRTFAAVGQNDIDLPVGNVLRGVLGFGTTRYTGAVPAPTLGNMQLLRDNQQQYYTSTDFTTQRGNRVPLSGTLPFQTDHTHDLTGATTELTTRQPITSTEAQENYVYLDLDPTRDDTFSMDTTGANRVQLRVNAGTADLARFVVFEKVATGDFFGG